MAQFCSACGAQMADGSTTCPSCGKSTAQSVGGGAAAAPAPAASGSENIIALLCYSPVAIVGIIMGLAVEPYKNSKLVRFHAWQSLFMCIALFAVSFGLGIISSVLGAVAGPLALLMFPVFLLYGVAIFGLCIFMMMKAYNNQMYKLPIVGEFAAKQAGA
jgi:uncharacterized membrane protein